MDKMLEVQRKILTQPEARKAFAADPRGFLTKEGVTIPEGVSIPKSLPLAEFEKRVALVEKQLKSKGVDLHHLNAEQLKKAGLVDVRAVESLGKTEQELSTEQLQGVAGGLSVRTTEATAAAVVALVVAVTVGVWSVL